MSWAGRLFMVFALVGTAAAAERAEWIEPATGMRFVRIPGGCFTMGTKQAPFAVTANPMFDRKYRADYAADEAPAHRVCISSFWLARFEATAAEWERLYGHPPPEGHGAQPATGVAWRDAVRFAEELARRGGDQERYRLPTEGEWEYACLAGEPEIVQTESEQAQLSEHAVFWPAFNQSSTAPQPLDVGLRKPNAFGLHDMRGNAIEWTADAYLADGYRMHLLNDPRVERAGVPRVLRGGSIRSMAVSLRCAARFSYAEDGSLPFFGFRLVREEVRR